MLIKNTQIANVITRNARMMCLNADGSQQCVIVKKHLLRKDDVPDSTMGGIPTMGGMGVLSKLDEDDYEWELKGDGMCLFTGQVQPDSLSNNGAYMLPSAEITALVVSLKEPEEGGFFIEKGDVLFLHVAGEVTVAMEVISPQSPHAIAPYSVQFTLSPRDDLDFVKIIDDVQ
jgi:hypothetical protein